MNKAIICYERELKNNLKCGSATRRKLLDRFSSMLASFLEDNSDPTLEELYAAFGSPEELAETLTEALPAEELKRHKSRKALWRICAFSSAAILLLFLIYAVCVKGIESRTDDKEIVQPLESIVVTPLPS